jgi:hypothetical protein
MELKGNEKGWRKGQGGIYLVDFCHCEQETRKLGYL